MLLTGRHPEVRRRFFWQLIDERKRKKRSESELTYPIHLFSHFDVLKPIPDDLEWAIDDIKTRKDEADRVIALRMAIGLWYMAGGKWRDRRRIRDAIVNDASLLKEFKRLAEYGPRVWTKRIWYRHLKYKLSDEMVVEKPVLFCSTKILGVPAAVGVHQTYQTLEERYGNEYGFPIWHEKQMRDHSQWAPRTWNKLVEKRGRLIAWAAREGCKSVWRQFVPSLPHEKPTHFRPTIA